MMIIGIDAHKRSHTAVGIDDKGRARSTKTVGTTSQDHLRLVHWAASLGEERLWAIEDCRHLTRRLERDLIGATKERTRRSNSSLLLNCRYTTDLAKPARLAIAITEISVSTGFSSISLTAARKIWVRRSPL